MLVKVILDEQNNICEKAKMAYSAAKVYTCKHPKTFKTILIHNYQEYLATLMRVYEIYCPISLSYHLKREYRAEYISLGTIIKDGMIPNILILLLSEINTHFHT